MYISNQKKSTTSHKNHFKDERAAYKLTKVELLNKVAERLSLIATGNGGIWLIKPDILFMLLKLKTSIQQSPSILYKKIPLKKV